MEAVLLAIGIAGFTYFTVRWMQLRSGYRSMSSVEQRYAEVSAEQDAKRTKSARRGPVRRLHLALSRAGFGDDLFPLVAAASFGYLLTAVGLRIVLPVWLAAVIAVPVGVVIAWLVNQWAVKARANRFNNQMILLLELVTGQVKGGAGAERALTLVVPTLPDPMREEMTAVIEATGSGGDLIVALRGLREKYPSRAFDMFLSALEIDRSEGHSIAPALEQAADLLKKSFALQSEARAEITSTKWEFYAVAAVIVALTLKIVLESDPATAGAFTSVIGVVLLVAGFANMGWGFLRFNKLIAKIGKDSL